LASIRKLYRRCFASLQRFLAETNRLFDHPSYRLCRLASLEIREIEEYGQQAIKCLVLNEDREALSGWLDMLGRILRSAGDLDGTSDSNETGFERMFSAAPYRYDGVPQRDRRFKDPYNMGVNAEAMLFDPDVEPLPKSIMLYFKRMREIDVPEVISSILSENTGRSWEYYRDMTRQLWDEARHAMMGEVGFASLGIDWSSVPLNLTWSLELNTKLDPQQRHAVLFTIEQGLMPKKNGKEYEWQVALATHDRLTALIQDYDWADEVLHAQIGRRALAREGISQQDAIQRAGEIHERTWATLDDYKGREAQTDWWPSFVRENLGRESAVDASQLGELKILAE